MAIRMLSVLLVFVLAAFSFLQSPTFAIRKSYVVYLGGHSHGPDATLDDYNRVTDYHHDFLGSFLGSKEKAQEAVFYSYQKHINGFAARLEDEEAVEISKHPDVVSVFLNKAIDLVTTHSWQFLGLERDGTVPSESLWQKAKFGEDIIIGGLDTGVWPESESFSDEGMGPVPSKWKGFCQNNTKEGVPCNRKLIGARYFNKGFQEFLDGPPNATYNSARDPDGHGSHTLSTAGGRFVSGANVLGYANGTAKGGSPNARVAMYRVCFPPINGGKCTDADVIAGFDEAIDDGVDLLTVSLVAEPRDYFDDGIAIGSFHAVKHGIPVICAAGNTGPQQASVVNSAPWIITVAASNMDRDFPSYVKLGNNKEYKGQSLSTESLAENMYPLISSSDAKAPNAAALDADLCFPGALDPAKVKGKIVACLRGNNSRVEKGQVVRQAGGIGMVLVNDAVSAGEITPDAHFLPATQITYSDGLEVYSYINSTQSPVAYITRPKTDVGNIPAPSMGTFSSQGPNSITPEILKPDITAPGVNILAAFSQAISPSTVASDKRRVLYNILFGTSMATPHVSGVVGLLKALHPDWSPAAIRSAIMTTAEESVVDSPVVKATPFSYGAGHISPNKATDPGLIYDLAVEDYLNFLCTIGYNSTQISSFAEYKCPSNKTNIMDLNYPSITVPISSLNGPTTVTRTVRNVASPGTTYAAHVDSPAGVSTSVEPSSLTFATTGEEKTYKVTLSLTNGKLTDYVFGRLVWSDGVHNVKSPIVVSSDG